MTVRIEVRPELFAWARARSRRQGSELARRFKKLALWESGEVQPTMRQLEDFAKATFTPIGYFLAGAPPQEVVPIPDYRAMADEAPSGPSANLLDTIFKCQERQDWYRSFLQINQEQAVDFVGAASLADSPTEVADGIRERIGFGVAQRGSTFVGALSLLLERVEAQGVLVMVNGVVGSNTRRKLDPQEFRGFALVDNLAPLIFVNGADTKGAQIFTVAHELAHVWLGKTGLDDANMATRSSASVEKWCNKVAAEFLLPLSELRAASDSGDISTEALEGLAKRFKVSTLVVLRRIFDARLITWEAYSEAYETELERVLSLQANRTSGGNFYNTQPVRASKRFTRAVIASTLEGQTLYTEAFSLLGFKKKKTFDALAVRMDVA